MTLEFIPQRKIIIAAFFIILALYVIFQARNLLLGPRLEIISPTENQTLAGPVIEVIGTAKNVSFISLNDHQIFIDDSGHFKESLLPSPGLVILKLVGKDRFGRQNQISESIFVTGKNIKVAEPDSSATTSATQVQSVKEN
ncbi:MAG: hypothetical protein WA051_00835 [Minisyncoccia bacterium]